METSKRPYPRVSAPIREFPRAPCGLLAFLDEASWGGLFVEFPRGTVRCTVVNRYPAAGGRDKFVARLAIPLLPDVVRMDVQIFGVKKSAETRKALRFFAERRTKTHFVDLQERAASRGELTRFAQKFGVAALVDEESRRFGELGLRTARYGDERWLDILVDEPLILKIPPRRCGPVMR